MTRRRHGGSEPSPGLEPATAVPHAGSPGGLGRLLRYFLLLGSTGFGGPIATVGYMQRDLVEARGWINRRSSSTGSRSGRRCPGRWRRK
jgi:chromate transporter